MKKLLKAIWNMIIIAIVLAIVPCVFMIDVLRVYLPYYF